MQYVALIAGVVAVVAAMPFYVRWSMRRDRAQITAIPIRPIAEVAEGARVRVIGKAEALDGDTTRSVLWRGEAVRAPGPHAVGGAPAPVIAPHFRVTDDTGSIEVATEHLDLRAGAHLVRDELTQGIAKRHQQGIGYERAMLENRIEPGQRIAVVATVRRRPDGTRELAGTDREPVIIAEP